MPWVQHPSLSVVLFRIQKSGIRMHVRRTQDARHQSLHNGPCMAAPSREIVIHVTSSWHSVNAKSALSHLQTCGVAILLTPKMALSHLQACGVAILSTPTELCLICRRVARPPAHQCGGRQPEPGVGGALPGAQP
jgi:hypothetical protein